MVEIAAIAKVDAHTHVRVQRDGGHHAIEQEVVADFCRLQKFAVVVVVKVAGGVGLDGDRAAYDAARGPFCIVLAPRDGRCGRRIGRLEEGVLVQPIVRLTLVAALGRLPAILVEVGAGEAPRDPLVAHANHLRVVPSEARGRPPECCRSALLHHLLARLVVAPYVLARL